MPLYRVLTWELPRESEAMKNDCISIGLCIAHRSDVICWWLGVRLWLLERMVDAVIRLYLKNYKPVELVQLYNALTVARAAVLSPAPSHVASDLDEIMVYLSGYMDAKGESAK